MEGCNPDNCPIGVRLNEHIAHSTGRHDELVIEFKEFRKDMESYNRQVTKHMEQSLTNDKLIEQKITFWAKIIAWASVALLSVFGAILFALWRVMLWLFGVDI